MPTVLPGLAEYLTIDDVPCSTKAWQIADHTPLWNEAQVRGSDVLVPGIAGVIPQRRRRTVTSVSLPMMFWGDFDSDGTPATDVREQLWLNVAEFQELVIEPTGVGDGTRAAVLHLAGGHTLVGDVHVLGQLALGGLADGPTAVRGVLDLSIPAGRLFPA